MLAPSREPLRAAIIGLRHGHVGRLDPRNPSPGYIHTFKQLAGVRVVAYCLDAASGPLEHLPDAPASNPAADSQGGDAYRLLDHAQAFDPAAHVYRSLDDLLAAEEFELACVVLPAHQVPGVGVRLAEAGKHFFMEKQFARTAAELAPLVRAVRENGVRVLAGYPWHFHPAAREIQRLIDDGTLGRPLSIESRLVTTQVRPGGRDPAHFLYRRETEGGGVLHMLGGHCLQLMRAFMGCEVRAVQAMTGRPVGRIEEPLEDVAIAAFEYENGAYGSIHAGYLHPALGEGYDSCLVYRGESGWATWTPIASPQLEVRSSSSAWSGSPKRSFSYTRTPFSCFGGERWFFDIMQRFVEDIQEHREPAVTVDDALHVLQLIDATYQSARTGRRVEVSYGVDAVH